VSRRASAVRLGLLALTWGSSFLWITLALPWLAASWLTVARLALGSATLALVCLVRRHRFPRGRRTWGHLVVAALLANTAPYYLFAVGAGLTSSAYAGILNGTTPLWTALTLLALTRRTPPAMQALGLLVGFAGTVVIFEPWRETGTEPTAGILACLTAAALYGLSFVHLARHVTPLPFDPVAVAACQLAAATILSLGLLPLDGATVGTPTGPAIAAVLVLGIVGTGLAYVLNYAILDSDGATFASLVAYLIPVVAAILGVLVLGDALPPLTALGAAVVLLGVALVRRDPRPAPPPGRTTTEQR
jgi:drug/metabolite transporter (DMT)-like permease